jgi:hypothetical protein
MLIFWVTKLTAMNLRRAILMHLHKTGVYTDISEFIMNKFEVENQDAYNEINLTITRLFKEELIALTSIRHNNYLFGNQISDYILTFAAFRENNLVLEAKITPIGIEKVEEWKLRKSVKKTNRVSRRMSRLAVGFAGVTLIISALQFFKKPDELLQPTLQSLQKELEQSRLSQPRETDRLIDGLKTDTVRVKISK